MFNAYNSNEIKDKSPTLSLGSMVTSSCATTIFVKDKVNGKYEVRNGKIKYNNSIYNTKLKDGKYILRKLSPIECERLQNLPDNYTEGVSNSQRYKMIGNGWTVDVISWILKHYHEEEN